MQWLLVVACSLVGLQSECSQTHDTHGQVAKSRHFGNTMLPVEHRNVDHDNSPYEKQAETHGEQMENKNTGSQLTFPTNGFRLSYPLHEFGSPFYTNFNRPAFDFPSPDINPINFPQYDGEFNFLKKPTRKFYIRHDYDDKGCRHDKDEKPTFSNKDDFSKNPNFHQRFDLGPDGFGPLGRKPLMSVDTDFFKQPILYNNEESSSQENNDKRDLKTIRNPFDYTYKQRNPFNHYGFSLHPKPVSNRNSNFRILNNIKNKRPSNENTNVEVTDKESNRELREYTPDTQESNEDDNKSSQDRFSRRHGTGWHPSRS